MPSMLLRRDDVIVGVDTHKDEHVAVLRDGLGAKIAELFIPATLAGFAELLAFCLEHVGADGRPRLRRRRDRLLRGRAGPVPAP